MRDSPASARTALLMRTIAAATRRSAQARISPAVRAANLAKTVVPGMIANDTPYVRVDHDYRTGAVAG